MAETLKDFLLALALLAVIALSAMAEDLDLLPDPTRPPAAVLASPEPAASSATPAPRLQGLRLGAAPSALVDGRLLRVGDRLGDARVQAIDAQGLLLKPDDGPGLRLKMSAQALERTP